jgi:hypothetical protein
MGNHEYLGNLALVKKWKIIITWDQYFGKQNIHRLEDLVSTVVYKDGSEYKTMKYSS